MCIFFCSEADVACDPGEAVVRVRQQAGGGGVPGSRRLPAAQAHLVARRKEEAAARRGEHRKRLKDLQSPSKTVSLGCVKSPHKCGFGIKQPMEE